MFLTLCYYVIICAYGRRYYENRLIIYLDHKENLISYEILLIILEIPVHVNEILVINYCSDES